MFHCAAAQCYVMAKIDIYFYNASIEDDSICFNELHCKFYFNAEGAKNAKAKLKTFATFAPLRNFAF